MPTNCKDCKHNAGDVFQILKNTGLSYATYADMCEAPQVKELSEVGLFGIVNSCISCQDARQIRTLCGGDAHWFELKG